MNTMPRSSTSSFTSEHQHWSGSFTCPSQHLLHYKCQLFGGSNCFLVSLIITLIVNVWANVPLSDHIRKMRAKQNIQKKTEIIKDKKQSESGTVQQKRMHENVTGLEQEFINTKKFKKKETSTWMLRSYSLTFNVLTFKCLVLPCWPDFFGHLKLEIAGLHKNRYIFCSI